MNTNKASILIAGVLAAAPFLARGESDGFLANAPGFRPKITVSDSYVERPVLAPLDRAAALPRVVAREKVAITVVANLDYADEAFQNFSANTEVRLAVGDLVIARCLGEDPKYTEGRTQAVFPLVKNVARPDGTVVRKTLGRLAFAWNDRRLAVTLTCTDLDAAGLGSIHARTLAGEVAPGSREKIVDKPVTVAVEFGSFGGSRTVYLDGVNRTETRRYRSAERAAYTEFDLATVTLAGAADITSPLASAVFAPTVDYLGRLTIGGFACDPNGVGIKTITINGGEPFPPVITFGEPDVRGICTWRVEELYLRVGWNDVVVTLTDADGNERSFTRRINVNAPQWD